MTQVADSLQNLLIDHHSGRFTSRAVGFTHPTIVKQAFPDSLSTPPLPHFARGESRRLSSFSPLAKGAYRGCFECLRIAPGSSSRRRKPLYCLIPPAELRQTRRGPTSRTNSLYIVWHRTRRFVRKNQAAHPRWPDSATPSVARGELMALDRRECGKTDTDRSQMRTIKKTGGSLLDFRSATMCRDRLIKPRTFSKPLIPPIAGRATC